MNNSHSFSVSAEKVRGLTIGSPVIVVVRGVVKSLNIFSGSPDSTNRGLEEGTVSVEGPITIEAGGFREAFEQALSNAHTPTDFLIGQNQQNAP